jgi:hypothetical protein
VRIATGALRALCLAAFLAVLGAALPSPAGAAAAISAKVKLSDASGPESAPSLKFKVRINGRTEAPIRVTYSTFAGTATPKVDFKEAKGQLSFQPSKREKAIVVKLVPDGQPEGRETFGLKLWDPDGATISRARARGTIRDDDPAPNPTAHAGVTSAPPVAPRVVINELLPNPVGAEVDYRYVELLNASGSAVDLSGWTFDSGGECALSGVVGAGDTFVVSNDLLIRDASCPLALLSAGEKVTLRDGPSGSGAVVDAVDYSDFATATGESLSLDPSKADSAQNDMAVSWCKAKEAGALTYDPEGNYGSPGALNGACSK